MELVRYFLECRCPVDHLSVGGTEEEDDEDNSATTPLFIAAAWGHVEVMRILIQTGANLNITGQDWDATLFECACSEMNASLDVVKLIIELGMEPKIRVDHISLRSISKDILNYLSTLEVLY